MPTYSQDKEFASLMVSSSALDEAIDWIAKNLNPDDVFSQSDLEDWAERNGFIKE